MRVTLYFHCPGQKKNKASPSHPLQVKGWFNRHAQPSAPSLSFLVDRFPVSPGDDSQLMFSEFPQAEDQYLNVRTRAVMEKCTSSGNNEPEFFVRRRSFQNYLWFSCLLGLLFSAWDENGPWEIVTGSFPCQIISTVFSEKKKKFLTCVFFLNGATHNKSMSIQILKATKKINNSGGVRCTVKQQGKLFYFVYFFVRKLFFWIGLFLHNLMRRNFGPFLFNFVSCVSLFEKINQEKK